MCLYEPEKKILISGDHLLGDITPNISCYSSDGDPLGDYLASLEKVRRLDIRIVLPEHPPPREKALFEQLAKESTFRPRPR